MKIILLVIISGITNGSDIPFKHQMEKQYSDLKECVQASITIRRVLHAQDNLQARETDVYTSCHVSQENLSSEEYAQATHKIRRLEKFYSTQKW